MNICPRDDTSVSTWKVLTFLLIIERDADYECMNLAVEHCINFSFDLAIFDDLQLVKMLSISVMREPASLVL